MQVVGMAKPRFPLKVVSGATLTFTIKSARDHAGTDPALNVYIFTNAAPSTTGTDLYYHGPSNSTAVAKFVGSTSVEFVGTGDTELNQEVSYSLSGEALNVLKRFYNADHTPDVVEAFFRFNLDQVMPAFSDSYPYQRYKINVAEGASSLTIIHADPPPTIFRFR